MSKELKAVLASFAVFLSGILLFAAAWPSLGPAIGDRRLIVLVVFGYLLLLRLAGRWLAKKLWGKAS